MRADDTLWDRPAFWPPIRDAFPRRRHDSIPIALAFVKIEVGTALQLIALAFRNAVLLNLLNPRGLKPWSMNLSRVANKEMAVCY